jgi:hypothetical protein
MVRGEWLAIIARPLTLSLLLVGMLAIGVPPLLRRARRPRTAPHRAGTDRR